MPLLVILAAVLLVVIAGVVGGAYALGRFGRPDAAVGTSPSASPTAVANSTDPHAQRACDLAAQASNADTLTDPAVAAQIAAEARQGDDTGVSIEAALLQEQQKIATAAHGQSDEAARLVDVVSQSIRLQAACARGGFAQ